MVSVCVFLLPHDYSSKSPESPGRDPVLAIVDLKSMRLRRTIEPPFGPNYFGITPSGSHLMLFDGEGKLVIWDIMNNRSVREHAIAAGGLHVTEFFDGGREAILGYCNFQTPETNNCLLSVWDTVRGELKKVLSSDLRNHILSATVNHDRSIVAILLSDSVLVLESKTYELICRIIHGQMGIGEVMFTNDGSRLVSISEDRLLKIWEIPTGELLLSLELEQALHQLTMMPDSSDFLAVTDRGNLCRYSLPISQSSAYLHESAHHWKEISFSADFTKVIAVSDANEVYGWDVETKQPVVGTLEMPSEIRRTTFDESAWLMSDERGIFLQRWLFDLKPELHDLYEYSTPRLSRWYRDQAEKNEREAHWYAAMHYWAWLFKNDRDDMEVVGRFQKAYQQWRAERNLSIREMNAASSGRQVSLGTLRPNIDEKNLLSPVLSDILEETAAMVTR